MNIWIIVILFLFIMTLPMWYILNSPLGLRESFTRKYEEESNEPTER